MHADAGGNPSSATESCSPSAWLAAVRVEEHRGEFLAAYDLATRGLAEHPDDRTLQHRAVLALARTGATQQAAERFLTYGLADVADEDVASLRARIAKDRALAAAGAERRRRAARAAELYAAVHRNTGGSYPAINAATLWRLAGERDRARALARAVLDMLGKTTDSSYWAAATAAEASLLLGDTAAVAEALEAAAARVGSDFGALATTRKQLRLICEAEGFDRKLLAPLAGPAVAFYCGHIIGGDGPRARFPAAAEARVEAAIARAVASHPVGFAYGALAAGADIMWAEALLAAGAELHVVLPFSRREFVERSVAVSGNAWIDRFECCLAAATEARYATDDAYLGDDVLFRYASELGMGRALLRGSFLDAEVRLLAVWDGRPESGAAGTAIDVATWRGTGRPATVVRPSESGSHLPPAPRGRPTGPPREAPARGRVVRAMLFGDVSGFSKLTDEQLPAFTPHILGALARVVERHERHVLFRNTWGDALYLVFGDVAAAAHCALDLQDAMAAIDLDEVGLPSHLTLRLGGHVGPVFPVFDPLLGAEGFIGSHVSRTARIEPVTPPGSVYVTEAFAAALLLAGHQKLGSDYVGQMAAAKGYGRLSMYRLRRADPGGEGPD